MHVKSVEAQTSSRWSGVVVRIGGANSSAILAPWSWFKITSLSYRSIATRVGRDPMTVSRIWSRWVQDGNMRHPITSSREDKYVTCMPLIDRAATSRAPNQESGSFCLQWCDQRGIWTHEWPDESRGITFSDESRFSLHHQDSRILVWWHRRTLAASVRHRYTGASPGVIQDNARPHVADTERTFFDTENVWLLSCSARSLDFSPIESVWSTAADKLARHHTPVTAVDELWHLVEAAWTFVPVHLIQSLDRLNIQAYKYCLYFQKWLFWVLILRAYTPKLLENLITCYF
ncbi:uncharacterized protein TNCV_4171151 [Trichonephila clavipes]|nr:uncharacterized protein TNCV_4171151 [Trichonephila clavipes]